MGKSHAAHVHILVSIRALSGAFRRQNFGSAPIRFCWRAAFPARMGAPPSSFSVEQSQGRKGWAMLDRKIYKLMKKKYSDVGSWAVWCLQTDKNAPKSNMGNMEWAEDEGKLCSELNPNFVFVGLNKSKSPEEDSDTKPAWKNFHSGNSRSHSYKLRYALTGTPFWGAYMTDLIKQMPEDKDPNKVVKAIETKSKDVVRRLKKNKALLERNLKNFEREISHLGGKPVLIALGDDVFDFLQLFNGKYKILPLTHYSYTGINKEQYRDEVRTILRKHGKWAKK